MAALAAYCCSAQVSQSGNEPIIDMHLHALHANELGPPPRFICAPNPLWPTRDPKTPGEEYGTTFTKTPPCASPLRSPLTDEELMNRTLAIMRARNVTAVASSLGESLDLLDKWKRAGGDRILRAIPFNPKSGKPSIDELRKLVAEQRIDVFAEVQTQYLGIAANDPRMEPYYALAEELDVPIGIHMGPGPPGAPYHSSPNYRMHYSSLLLLEDVLVRHPRLRIWAMHAGWPFADDTIAALYAHPQLYVDVGVICYAFPRKQFYDFLQRLVDAGFEKRIMFGSDEMVWPDALSAGIDSIENAPSLTREQKRDILYNNAARFLRFQNGHSQRGAY
ncbi:MAG TPA: amidohydrolase family protein [Terriglobales bacterium]|nr:amidohydrolase family protein [Acidobacteriaceae bacterium]HKR30287.1 amidohydrolase family protein [Terriglobales bacterium]